MKSELEESISRILLIIFVVMMLISSTFLVPAGGLVVLYACWGFLLIIALFLGVEKHRKYVCIGLVIVLVLIMVDHIAGQKLNQTRRSLYHIKMAELEKKLEKYEAQEISR
ncbi:MAG: hypothetical protein ACYSPJ_04280 [Planctomycetota bacterium]|jgi:ABC-type multidrug transport system fused ATPase/permease subunit